MPRSCTLHEDGCITSPNYPDNYPVSNCTIVVDSSNTVPIDVVDWKIESGQTLVGDELRVNGKRYSTFYSIGANDPVGPDGIVPRGSIL